MSFEEEFDSIIRRKAEEEKYPFDENNWDKANSLLDAERKTTRGLKLKQLYLPAIVVVSLGVIGFIAFDSLNKPTADNKVVATAKSVQTEENSAAAANAEAQTRVEAKNQVDPKGISDEAPNLNTVSSTSSNSLKPSAETDPISASPKASENNSPAKSISSVQKESVIVNSHRSKRSSEEPKPATDVATVTNALPAAELNDAGSAKQTTNAPEQVSNDANASNGKGNAPNSSSNDPKDEHINSTSNLNTVPSQNSISQQNIEKENKAFVEGSVSMNTTEESKLEAEHLSAMYTVLPFEINEPDVTPGSFVYLNRYDDDYYKNTKTPKKHYLNIEAGANYLLGWNAQKGMDGQGLNGFAGINYGRYLSNKISISLGVQAYNIANIKQPFYQVTSKEYGFGSTNIYTRVTSNQLYYVAVPLKFNYAINSSNTIGVGINAAYLVGANNTVSKYYILDNEQKNIGSPVHNKGVYTGTNMVNMMLSAHYKTQFGKRIGLNLEFNYGLTDIFKNTDAIKVAEKPMGIRLGLSYTLFDK